MISRVAVLSLTVFVHHHNKSVGLTGHKNSDVVLTRVCVLLKLPVMHSASYKNLARILTTVSLQGDHTDLASSALV